MEKKRLQQLIAKLHRELKSADTIDDESRDLLKQLTEDIDDLGEGESALSDAADQLEDAAVRFKSEHPKLSMVLSELVDALGKLGI